MHIRHFLHYLKSELRYSPHTITSYQKDLSEFQNFIEEKEPKLAIEQVELLHLRNFIIHLSEKKLKAVSINRHIAALKRFYKYLVKQGVIQSSPATALKNLKKPKQVQLPLSEEEMQRHKEGDLNREDFQEFQKWLIIDILYQTGMRRNELIELQAKDLDLSENSLKVLGKRNKERKIPVSKNVMHDLQHLQQLKKQENIHSDYLFSLSSGKKLYPKFVYNVVKEYLSTYTTKDKKSPHMLRHTFATHVLNNGAEINSVKELLGHSSLASTQVYTHQDIETLKKIFKENHPREINH